MRLLYRRAYGRFPSLRNPTTFDEKIQWYKLHYRKPVMATMADKFAVRAYLEERGFGYLLNELQHTYERVEDIDFAQLPQSFVLKATHGTNMNIICPDKSQLDWEQSCQLMNSWLSTNHYQVGREWAYKNIKPQIICEDYLENKEYNDLIDYKFYCYDGKPAVVWACTGRSSSDGVKYTAYDMDWQPISVNKGKPSNSFCVTMPDRFSDMQNIATELSQGFPFVRVDLYSVENKLFFGELTFYPDSGVVPFSPDHFNYFFGDLFQLSKCNEV